MKKLILCSLLLSTALFAVDNNQTVAPSNGAYKAKYDAIFDDLSKPRVGLSDEQIASLQDPFYPKEASAPREANQQVDLGYQLVGIMGDKVKLNDKWYGLGEYVGSYKIVQITGNSVIITNDDENKVELTLKQGSQNVIITYK
jgi:transformation system protein